MADKFKINDVVELNSGGPPMIIVGFLFGAPDVAVCTWAGGTDHFKVAMLKEFRPEPVSAPC